ncbi:SIS domain-containing protein [Frateuria aurantia]
MTTASDTLMFQETRESAQVVERQLRLNAERLQRLGAQLRAEPPRFVVTCARGSSDHAASYAKYVLETQLGIATTSASPSISSVYQAPQKLQGALFIAISQSGKSPDLLRSAEAAKHAGARVLAIVNVEDSPLAGLADLVLPLHAGPELSVAATKSFIASLTAILQLVAYWKDDAAIHAALADLPAQLTDGWAADWNPLVQQLVPVSQMFVVGRGFGFGAALESALKLKETCGLQGEAFSAAEVRHGPMAIVKQGYPVLFYVQDDETRASTLEVIEEFRSRDASVWVAGPGLEGPGCLPLAAGIPALTTPIVAIQSFYRAAASLSIARGYNPDVPPHLRKVTETV